MANLGFKSGVGFIPLISNFRKNNTTGLALLLVALCNPFTFLVPASLVRPIMPTLAILGNGIKSVDKEESFLLITPGLGTAGYRLVAVLIDDKFASLWVEVL